MALPYLGGVLAAISIFFPVVAHFHKNLYGPSHTIWIWGLVIITTWSTGFTGWAWENEFVFISDPFILILGIIISIFIVVIGIKTVFTARNFGRDEKHLIFTFVKYGGYIIISYILWMIILQVYYAITGFMGRTFNFWDYFNVNFGTVAIFLGGGFSILGYVLTKIFKKRFYYLFV